MTRKWKTPAGIIPTGGPRRERMTNNPSLLRRKIMVLIIKIKVRIIIGRR